MPVSTVGSLTNKLAVPAVLISTPRAPDARLQPHSGGPHSDGCAGQRCRRLLAVDDVPAQRAGRRACVTHGPQRFDELLTMRVVFAGLGDLTDEGLHTFGLVAPGDTLRGNVSSGDGHGCMP